MREIPFFIEGKAPRKIWGTLELPEKTSLPLIVMAHGLLGFKDWAFFPWLSESFAREGFPVARFNFSGSGMGNAKDGPFEELKAFEDDSISNQVEDLRFVIASALKGGLSEALPPQKEVFLWGHSRGGAVCLLTAEKDPAVKALATWATLSRVNRYLFETKQAWRKQGFSAVESSRTGQILKYATGFLEDVEGWGREGDVPTFLNRLKIPLFLVHGSEDKSVSPEESESLAAIYPQAQLAILSGADHKFNAAHPFKEASAPLIQAFNITAAFFRNESHRSA